MAKIYGGDEPHPVDRHVGRRVCERRISLGYNQSELGRAIGLTFQQIQKYEKGSNRVSASKLWDIATFLDVDIDYFFQGLTRNGPGVGEPNHQVFHDDLPATRYSIEVSRLAPRLSSRRQKLARDLVEGLLDLPDVSTEA